jgi:hypothetical protein
MRLLALLLLFSQNSSISSFDLQISKVSLLTKIIKSLMCRSVRSYLLPLSADEAASFESRIFSYPLLKSISEELSSKLIIGHGSF